MKRQDKEKHSFFFFLISLALMALSIRKRLFHHMFCGHPVDTIRKNTYRPISEK